MRKLLILLITSFLYSNPNIIWSDIYGVPGISYSLGSIIELSDGNFIVSEDIEFQFIMPESRETEPSKGSGTKSIELKIEHY